jgi:hypothetical protein
VIKRLQNTNGEESGIKKGRRSARYIHAATTA